MNTQAYYMLMNVAYDIAEDQGIFFFIFGNMSGLNEITPQKATFFKNFLQSKTFGLACSLRIQYLIETTCF